MSSDVAASQRALTVVQGLGNEPSPGLISVVTTCAAALHSSVRHVLVS